MLSVEAIQTYYGQNDILGQQRQPHVGAIFRSSHAQPVPIEGKGFAHFGQTDIQPDRPAGSRATRERGERSWRAALF